jgi:hypothetical protein
MLLGVTGDLAALGYFKYADFFIASINTVAGSDIGSGIRP